MMEEIECVNCKKVSRELHLCRIDEQGKNVPWSCCGDNKYGHMNKKTIEELKFTCGFCGRVAPVEDFLCEPKEISSAVKATYKNAVMVKDGDHANTCKTCGQPVVLPGHSCDVKEAKFKCKYCGKLVDTTKHGESVHHMCSEIVKKAKYFCRVCGRLAVEEWELCTPIKLK
jgi:hypothetical protein